MSTGNRWLSIAQWLGLRTVEDLSDSKAGVLPRVTFLYKMDKCLFKWAVRDSTPTPCPHQNDTNLKSKGEHMGVQGRSPHTPFIRRKFRLLTGAD
ncbi:MAG: hypothetical protein K6T90_01725 [Leptolyngbyaceae cyanobacterium HOT.MB2.61]|nr:hypothetical protein [Leptolyngbyaceae cyanobacterium HOT.MB2.61]